MRRIIIELPETEEELKEFEKSIREIEKGSLREASKFRKHVNKEFGMTYQNSLFMPFCCETCKYEGGACWHCHNPKSPKCYINVDKNNLCKHYQPNWGLMTFLWYRAFMQRNKEKWLKGESKTKEERKCRKNKNTQPSSRITI